MLPVNPVDLYLSHRPLMTRIVTSISRAHRLSASDAEDFRSAVDLHLIKDDYAALRAFEGRSEWSTYLYAVIRRCLQDWRYAQWGRWRPSAAARRLGPVAILLDVFISRDGLTVDQAIEMLRTNHGVDDTPEHLRDLAAQLPRRTRATPVPIEAADGLASDGPTADWRVEQADVDADRARVSAALDAAIGALPPQDRLLLQLRFEQGLEMAAVGALLGAERKPLYRRVERVLAQIRAALLAKGITAEDAARILDQRGLDERAADALATRRRS